MTVHINTALQNRLCNSAAQGWDGGATFDLYTGSRPASANDGPSGTVLATITLPADAFDDAFLGQAAKLGTWATTATDTGNVGWGRMTSADASLVMDLEALVDFNINEVTIGSVGDPVSVTLCVLTQPSGE